MITGTKSKNDAQEYYEDELYEAGGAQWFSLVVVLMAIAGFIWLAYYAYQTGSDLNEPEELPLIEADGTPISREPENPGGLEIPHQDKSVYEMISGESGKATDKPVTKVRPEPEKPLEKPVVAQEEVKKKTVEAPKQKTELLMGEKIQAQVKEKPPVKKVEEAVAKVEAASEEKAEEVKKTAEKALESVSVASVPVASKPVAAAPAVKKVETPKPASQEVKKAAAPVAVAKKIVSKPSVAPKVISSGKPMRVQLGAYSSYNEAIASWKKIRAVQSALLGSVGHSIERADLGAKGVFHRLKVGPLANKDAAAALCTKLKAKGQGCFVTR